MNSSEQKNCRKCFEKAETLPARIIPWSLIAAVGAAATVLVAFGYLFSHCARCSMGPHQVEQPRSVGHQSASQIAKCRVEVAADGWVLGAYSAMLLPIQEWLEGTDSEESKLQILYRMQMCRNYVAYSAIYFLHPEVNVRGALVLAYGQPVPDSPRLPDAEVDQTEVGAGPRRIGLYLIIAALALAIAVGTLFYVVLRRKVKSLALHQRELEWDKDAREVEFQTEREYRQGQLRERERRYAELVENANSAIIRWKSDGTITFFNMFAQEFFGYREDEACGKSVAIIVPRTESTGRDLSNLIEDIVRRPERYFKNVNENVRRDGSRVWMAWTNKPVFDSEGNVTEVLAVGTDVTDRVRAEEQLRILNSELERTVARRTAALQFANQELEAFAYSVSHDLRAPLRAIDGYSKILLDDYSDRVDEDGRFLLVQVRDCAKEMGLLIDDLLAFSRMSRQNLVLQDLNIEAMVRLVFQEVTDGCPDRVVRLDLRPLPPARGDKAMVREVLRNLLGNAVKFTRPQAEAVIEVTGNRHDSEVIYRVRDNGVGFDERYSDKLFNVFQRLHRSEEYEGTGVGLALVRRIVEKHGGRVGAEGDVGKGAAFWFSLPLGNGGPEDVY